MSPHSDIFYLRHSIKTRKDVSGYKARAFRGITPIGDIFLGATQEAAVLAVKKFLKNRAAELFGKRGPSGFPCPDEIGPALRQLRINKAQEAMLRAHFNAPNHILTATELAHAAGYEDYAVANRQYGQLAHDLAHELDWTPNETHNGKTIWTFTIADDADKQSPEDSADVSGQWRWKLRSEVIEALSHGHFPVISH